MTLTLYGVTSDGTSVPIEVTEDGKLVIDTSGTNDFIKQGDDVEFGTGDFSGNVKVEGSIQAVGRIFATGTDAHVDVNYNGNGASDVHALEINDLEGNRAKIATDGSAEFGRTTFTNEIVVGTRDNQGAFFTLASTGEGWNGAIRQWQLGGNGNCTFTGTVVIGSRGALWEIRESNGVAMLVQKTRTSTADYLNGDSDQLVDDSGDSAAVKVRDLPNELDLVESALNEVMARLRMVPPAGWPVWDGQSEVTSDNDNA